MQRFLLLFCLLVSYSFANAQISDIPDYRPKKDNYKKILDKGLRSELAAFTLSSLDEALNKESLPKLPLTENKPGLVQFSNGKISVTITAGTFDKTKHKLMLYDDKYTLKLDNKPFFSAKLGDMPKKTIESVFVTIGRDTVQIPATAINDLYDPVFCTGNVSSDAKCNCAVYLSNDGGKIFIYMLNSIDNKNGYEVTWIIQDKLFSRRVVDFGF